MLRLSQPVYDFIQKVNAEDDRTRVYAVNKYAEYLIGKESCPVRPVLAITGDDLHARFVTEKKVVQNADTTWRYDFADILLLSDPKDWALSDRKNVLLDPITGLILVAPALAPETYSLYVDGEAVGGPGAIGAYYSPVDIQAQVNKWLDNYVSSPGVRQIRIRDGSPASPILHEWVHTKKSEAVPTEKLFKFWVRREYETDRPAVAFDSPEVGVVRHAVRALALVGRRTFASEPVYIAKDGQTDYIRYTVLPADL